MNKFNIIPVIIIAAVTFLSCANAKTDLGIKPPPPRQQFKDMTTQYLFDDIAFDEGVKLKPYRDSRNIWSIGIGHNIQADPTLNAQLAHLMQTGITLDQAKAIFQHDVKTAELGLDLHVPWWRTLDDVRQDSVLNICFNVGCGGLLTWHHTLGYLQTGQFSNAYLELLNTQPWHNQVGHRAERIAMQIKTGVRQYPDPKNSQFALARPANSQ